MSFSEFSDTCTITRNKLPFCFSKSKMPQEKIDLINKLSKESDIYERLARAIGKYSLLSYISGLAPFLSW